MDADERGNVCIERYIFMSSQRKLPHGGTSPARAPSATASSARAKSAGACSVGASSAGRASIKLSVVHGHAWVQSLPCSTANRRMFSHAARMCGGNGLEGGAHQTGPSSSSDASHNSSSSVASHNSSSSDASPSNAPSSNVSPSPFVGEGVDRTSGSDIDRTSGSDVGRNGRGCSGNAVHITGDDGGGGGGAPERGNDALMMDCVQRAWNWAHCTNPIT